MLRLLLIPPHRAPLWSVQCLDHDIAADGPSIAAALCSFWRVLVGQVALDVANGKPPLKDIPPAPAWYWKMSKPIGARVRERLGQYLRGVLSLEDFERWFIPATWNIHLSAPESQDFAYEIELRLIEYSNGDWTEGELKGLLQMSGR